MVMAIAMVMVLGMMSHIANYQDTQEKEHLKKIQFEQRIADAKSRNPESFKDIEIKPTIVAKPTIVKQKILPEQKPQINNYNFENIGKGLLALGGVLSVIFGIKYIIKLFGYLSTIRRFKKNEKRTNYLLNKLKVCFDDQKELLLLSDNIEHQLKLNDLLLKSDDAKQHGIHLEVADDYLYSEYTFINSNLLNKLK